MVGRVKESWKERGSLIKCWIEGDGERLREAGTHGIKESRREWIKERWA